MDFSNQLFAYDNLFSDEQLNIPVAKIFQVSELSIVNRGEIVVHTQQCDEITYIVSGSGTVFSDGCEDELHAGHIHYIRKGHVHQILANKNENLRFICIGFLSNENHNIFELYSTSLLTVDKVVFRKTNINTECC